MKGVASGGFEAPGEIRGEVRRLLVLLPDQLHLDYLGHAGLDRGLDALVQIEVEEDFTHVPSHKQRTALFLSAMRHFALAVAESGWRSGYVSLDDAENGGDLRSQVVRLGMELRPGRLVAFRPGDYRTLEALQRASSDLGIELELLEDPHFLVSTAEFEEWTNGRKTLVLDHFYRWIRRRTKRLLTEEGQPEGGSWNYDSENRKSLGRGAPERPSRHTSPPDAITREVLDLVNRRFADAPGRLDSFFWPVDRDSALEALDHFIEHGLPYFGDYQDAMKTDEPWLFHSLLSPALNLKLLDPRECVERAEAAYRAGTAPLNAVEGFIRQIIGWREFIRGVYWTQGPEYGEGNHLEETGRLPEFYWTGDTDLHCVAQAVGQVLEHGYGHHIQRLMVTGNFALVAGVKPQAVSDWYLGMYVDAIDWVTLPNTFGMVMYGDGGVVGSKPYAASGRYISRMSDYCRGCRFDPGERTGETACPITTLYWDFLDRHRDKLGANRRMTFSFKNLERLSSEEVQAIRERAESLRSSWGISD